MSEAWQSTLHYGNVTSNSRSTMGNNQSTECPSSLCKALCFGSPPANSDDGEWFGDLPKKRRRSRKRGVGKTTSSRRLPSVPEEASTCSDTVETDEGSSSVPLSSSSSVSKTIKPIDESEEEVGSSRPNLERRATEGQILKKSTSRGVKLPKAKFTFVHGQFVDMSTEEGREFAEMCAANKKDDDESSPDVSVCGVKVSVLYNCRIGLSLLCMKILILCSFS